MKIAVAGTGYVGLSLAVLLSQHNEVIAVDVIEEKVNKINNRISPIQDDEIENCYRIIRDLEKSLYAAQNEIQRLHEVIRKMKQDTLDNKEEQ